MKEILNETLKICPDNAVLDDSKDSLAVISFVYNVGMRGINIELKISPTHEILQAVQTYPFSSHGTDEFNDQSKKYKGYQAYGAENRLSITKRLTYPDTKVVPSSVTEFLMTVKEIVPNYEMNCIDFSQKMEEPGKEYDPTVIETIQPDDQPEIQNGAVEMLSAYQHEQKEYCDKVFLMLSIEHGENIEDTHGQRSFTKAINGGVLTVSIDPDEGMIRMDYRKKIDDPSAAYIVIADLQTIYPEMDLDYDGTELNMGMIVIPDRYNEEEVFAVFDDMCKAARSIKKDVDPEDEVKIASNLKEIIDKEAEDLLKREESLRKKEKYLGQIEAELNAERKNLEEERNEMHTNYEAMQEEYQKRISAVNRKEAELNEKLNSVEESMDAEKAKYLMSMERLTSQIARMKSGNGNGGMSKEDEAKYKARIRTLTQSRIAIEKELDDRMTEWRRKEDKYKEELKEKEKKIYALTTEMEEQAEIKFAKERMEYEKKIKDFEAAEEITKHEVNPDSYYAYLCEKDYDAKRRHGKNQDLIVYQVDKSISVTVVFGSLFFIDVVKVIKNKNQKVLSKLNDQVSDVKFFCRGQEVVARKYMSIYTPYADLETAAKDLSNYFDK